MKIKMNAGDFASAVGYAARFAARSAVIQTLQYVLIDAADNRVSFTGGDGETFAVSHESVDEVGEPGRLLLPARLLGLIASRLTDGTVSIEQSDQDVEIRCGGARFKVRGLDADEYPATDPVDTGTQITLKADVFQAFVDQVARAAATDESRPMLTGLLVDTVGDDLVGVATDSYRLAVRHLNPGKTAMAVAGTLSRPLIPTHAIEEAARAAAGTDTIELTFSDAHVRVTAGNRIIVSRLIDANFPDWQRLLPDPADATTTIDVDRVALLDALNRVSVVTTGMANVPLRMAADTAGGTLTLAAASEQLGEADEALTVDVTGEDITMSFNPDYLRAGLEAISTPKVRFASPGELKPTLLLPIGTDDDDVADYTYLIMPMRVS